MDQTHIYIRMFCGSLCGFGLLMLICTTPLNWVQFLVVKNGLELYAGLWISCNHELCWSRTPKPPCECHQTKRHRPHSSQSFLPHWLFIFLPPRSLCPHRSESKMGLRQIVDIAILFFGVSVYPFSLLLPVVLSPNLVVDTLFTLWEELFGPL